MFSASQTQRRSTVLFRERGRCRAAGRGFCSAAAGHRVALAARAQGTGGSGDSVCPEGPGGSLQGCPGSPCPCGLAAGAYPRPLGAGEGKTPGWWLFPEKRGNREPAQYSAEPPPAPSAEPEAGAAKLESGLQTRAQVRELRKIALKVAVRDGLQRAHYAWVYVPASSPRCSRPRSPDFQKPKATEKAASLPPRDRTKIKLNKTRV